MNGQRPKPYWLIVKNESSWVDVLTTNLTGDEETLPVFSFEEEARMFLKHRALRNRWRVRETTAGELISVLYGPCAFVKQVALDPLPEMDIEVLVHLVSMRREDFVEFLMSKQKLWLFIKERKPSRRTSALA